VACCTHWGLSLVFWAASIVHPSRIQHDRIWDSGKVRILLITKCICLKQAQRTG
jgi:hypothetical protein